MAQAKTASERSGSEVSGRLRKARTGDVLSMQRLINGFADKGAMLHRSLSELYENIRDFFVVVEDDQVVGCAALHVSWKDLAELKSLAVMEEAQGRGYGRLLIQACLDEAEEIGISRVFALTYVPGLFTKMGFQIVEKSLLPRKVWTECVYCPKFPDCGEIAVLIGINGASIEENDAAMPLSLSLMPRSIPLQEKR
jgi:amino-acid N-acetyltransferase